MLAVQCHVSLAHVGNPAFPDETQGPAVPQLTRPVSPRPKVCGGWGSLLPHTGYPLLRLGQHTARGQATRCETAGGCRAGYGGIGGVRVRGPPELAGLWVGVRGHWSQGAAEAGPSDCPGVNVRDPRGRGSGSHRRSPCSAGPGGPGAVFLRARVWKLMAPSSHRDRRPGSYNTGKLGGNSPRPRAPDARAPVTLPRRPAPDLPQRPRPLARQRLLIGYEAAHRRCASCGAKASGAGSCAGRRKPLWEQRRDPVLCGPRFVLGSRALASARHGSPERGRSSPYAGR